MYIWFWISCFIISRNSLLFKSIYRRRNFLNLPNYIMNLHCNAFYFLLVLSFLFFFFLSAESRIIFLQFMQEIASKSTLSKFSAWGLISSRNLMQDDGHFICLTFYAIPNSNIHIKLIISKDVTAETTIKKHRVQESLHTY